MQLGDTAGIQVFDFVPNINHSIFSSFHQELKTQGLSQRNKVSGSSFPCDSVPDEAGRTGKVKAL